MFDYNFLGVFGKIFLIFERPNFVNNLNLISIEPETVSVFLIFFVNFVIAVFAYNMLKYVQTH